MSDKNNASSGGIGVVGLLLVLFVGLKITDNIDWSWWWVMAPLWGPFVLILGIGGLALLGYFIYTLATGKKF